MSNSEFEKITGLRLDERDGHPYYGGSLDLENCTGITSLPEGLTVGGYLDLRGTGITSLPEGLTVGGSLDLENCTGITSLPEGLTVGGDLDLRGTGITSTVGVKRNLLHAALNKIRAAKNKREQISNSPKFWEWNGKKYIKVDGMFSILESHRGNIYKVRQIGKNKKMVIITDGENHWAHGETLREAREDLIFKINDRDTSSYKNLSLDDTLTFEEAIAAYRTITGSCAAGTRNYIENRLPKPHKERYTVREIIELTKGEYGSKAFEIFFSK